LVGLPADSRSLSRLRTRLPSPAGSA